MDSNFSSDKPIFLKKEDKFQRFNFAQRIAETIINRVSQDGIVIGIYGAWGEGKTSVINFIEGELKGKENIITLKFNPWRYHEEAVLLGQFFQKLAKALDSNVKTKAEQAGDLFRKYGKLVAIDIPLVGNLGEKIQGIGEVLGESDLEELKTRIETILKSTKSKVVIFIDDIDRLEKVEVHSIFRLVKLTGDFVNTTYVLSFDEAMVASAIGERFGAGDQKSGQNFLEKIIQVPLNIPVAQPEALKDFCLSLVDQALTTSSIELTDHEAKRFVNSFTGNILPKLDTPRLAVRYGNSLTFSLPLLLREVNTVDLMLIEAVKIFYPQHYQFIKSNPEYFIHGYPQQNSQSKEEEKAQSIKKNLEILNTGLTLKQQLCIRNLLFELFPLLKTVFTHNNFGEKTYEKWLKEKRIVSTKYFQRYFSYSITKGDLSDVVFESVINEITSKDIDEIIKSLTSIISQSSPEVVLNKLSLKEGEFEWNNVIKLSKAIIKICDLFPKGSGDSLVSYGSAFNRASLLIYQLIKNHDSQQEQFELSVQIMNEAKDFEFAYDINNLLRSADSEGEQIFTTTQYVELAKILIERSLKEAGEKPVFEVFDNPYHIWYLFKYWVIWDHRGVESYLKGFIKKDPNYSICLLRSFTPTGYGGGLKGAFKANLGQNEYQLLISTIDKSFLADAIRKVYSQEQIDAESMRWIEVDKSQNDLNIVRQFFHWFSKEQETPRHDE